MYDVMDVIRLKGRDNARAPMMWDNSLNAGFTTQGVKPWIRFNDEYPDIVISKQQSDPDSILNYYKILSSIRKQHPVMVGYPPSLEKSTCAMPLSNS